MAKRHWVALLLVVSLSLNLLVAGMAIARWQFGHDRPPPLIWAFKDLDQDSRAALRPILREGLSETSVARGELRAVSEEIRHLIEAEPLDQAALASALEKLREVTGSYQAQMHSTALKVLPKLNAHQRVKIAGRLLRPGGEPPPPRGRHPDGGRYPPGMPEGHPPGHLQGPLSGMPESNAESEDGRRPDGEHQPESPPPPGVD